MKIKSFFKSLNVFEILLLTIGLTATIAVSIIFKGNIFAIFTSVLGIISVVMTAKGNILGTILGILQCIAYSIISFKNAFYGEVIFYIAVLIPLNIIVLFQWLKNRSKEDKMIININRLKLQEILIALLASIFVFVGSFFLLKAFDTANLLLSTISISTCSLAIYFNLRREKLTFLVFIINNIIVISMWASSAIRGDLTVLPVIVCSTTNLASNIYGFINWTKLYKNQNKKNETKQEIR